MRQDMFRWLQMLMNVRGPYRVGSSWGASVIHSV